MAVKVLYFAWLRERIGEASEVVETNAKTVAELVEDLRDRGEEYELAFADVSAIRAAVDQDLVEFDADISGAGEVAFFPPMTGG
ncbi:molybdopterin converting factor subunit 1 [Amaricoccus tamworthensis]|uniref:molybdopterin converting factor subunit 1 n=1 Tax=Amaricoccus tamworthensis TaxID=57002 RepID=UPI003C7D281F